VKRITPVLIIAALAPAFSARVAPAHDALQVFTAFWTYVSALTSEGRLPEWIPFSRYGTPSSPILMYLTPVGYAVGAVGALLHRAAGFSDTLLLFKIAIAIEYVIFAAGMVRLGRLIFRSAFVQYAVATLGVLSSPWILSLDGNFHAFYMTPWVFSALALAFQNGAPRHLGAAALLTAFACVGNVPYFPPFFLLQLTVFAIPLAMAYPANARRLAFSWQSWLWMAVAALFFGVHLIALVKGMDGLAILSAGRDPVSNHVTLGTFLTYAGVTKPLPLLRELLTGGTTNGDNTWYMGLASLVLAPLSLLIPAPPLLRSIRWLALFLLLFSTGGLIATAGYYFPGMAYYRHVSIVFGVIRILIFFCAGFTIDQLIQNRQVLAGWRQRLPSLGRSAVLAGVLVFAVFELTHAQLHGPDLALILYPLPDPNAAWLWPVAARLVIYGAVLTLLWVRAARPALPFVLIAALAVDLAIFWGVGWAQWPRLDRGQAGILRQAAAPRPLPELNTRAPIGDVESQGTYFRFLSDTAPLDFGTVYVHTYFWAGADPCVPRRRTDFIAASIASLFERRGVAFDVDSDRTEARVLADPVLAQALACGRSRVISSAAVIAARRGYDWLTFVVENTGSATANFTVSEAAASGWRVTVDGTAAPLTPSDPALIGVSVPGGRHQVRFRFHRPLVDWLRSIEGVVSACAAVLLLALALRDPRTSA